MVGIFWLLPEEKEPRTYALEGITPVLHLACILASDLCKQGKKILLLANDQEQAQLLDEWLWQLKPERFTPHNLPGEGPHYGTPVEVSWQASPQRRACVINVCENIPEDLRAFKGLQEWHDFVPTAETEKVVARERFKRLRELGVQVSTQAIPDLIE